MLLLPFPVAAEVSDIFWSGIIMTLQNKNIQILIAEIFIANLKKMKITTHTPELKKNPITLNRCQYANIAEFPPIVHCTLLKGILTFESTLTSPQVDIAGPLLISLMKKKYKNENVTVHTNLIFNLIKGINIFPYFPI